MRQGSQKFRVSLSSTACLRRLGFIIPTLKNATQHNETVKRRFNIFLMTVNNLVGSVFLFLVVDSQS